MAQIDFKQLEKLYPLIIESIDQGVFTVDSDFVVTSFNAAAERIIGISREEAIGRKCHHVFRASICETSCALRQTLETGKPLEDVRIDVLNQDMEAIPISVSTAVLRDHQGNLIGGVEMFRDISEIENLKKLVNLSDEKGFAGIIGISQPMRELFQLLPDVAASDASVLIQGPSGSGKELVAQAIHDLSPRKEHNFIRINCGALPDSLLESELFGYVKGAFTDARKDKPGRFVQAHRGTILLDEIGDISPAFQVKLLRVLQEGELEPLGATKTVRVDVRVLCSTHRDLTKLVEEEKFREDLYYRLRVLPITLAPLRDRREDVPLLIEHFVARIGGQTGKPIRGLTREAIDSLVAYDFPGNIRELRNIIERAFVLCHDELIGVDHLPPEVRTQVPKQKLKPSEQAILRNIEDTRKLPKNLPPAALHIVKALDANNWNRSKTAKSLGIARNTLWRRMRDYGLLA